jgi:GAF domain-containing protein
MDMGDWMREAEVSDDAESRLNRLLNLILETAVDTLGYDAATASVRSGEGLSTMAATDQRLVALDEAQYGAGEGPCLSVLDDSQPVTWSLQDEPSAWVAFREAAEQAGISSSLSLHIPVDELAELAASLNLYARQVTKPNAEQLRTAEAFATQLAVAMQSMEAAKATARLAAGLAEAMRSRAVIEQAKGMLMSEHQITSDAAFGMLTEMSQKANVKLREVALRLVESRSKSSG